MRTIDDYCDAAKKMQNIPSDGKLAIALNVNHSAVSQWRTKRTWPSDSTMVRLAMLAGVDPHEALVDAAIWRNGNDGVVQSLWSDLKKKLTPIAAMLCLFMGLSAALPPPAKAADMPRAHLLIMEN